MRRESISARRKSVGKACDVQARRHSDLRISVMVPVVSVPEISKADSQIAELHLSASSLIGAAAVAIAILGLLEILLSDAQKKWLVDASLWLWNRIDDLKKISL